MAHGVASCAMLALLLAAGASARGGRSLLQNAQAPGTAATFPYYGTCDQLVDDNMFSLSNAISVTDTPAGKRVCVPVDYNPGCPQTVVRNGQTIPNYCCVDYTAGGILVQPNVYKFEMQVKSNCRNAILYGASNDGPKVLRGDGSTGQLALNWEATDTVIGTIQKARFTNVGITAANAAGSQICFTIDKNFNKGSGECDTVEELCLSGKGNCGGDMTIVESDKNPRPTGLKSHLCCPVQDPPTCMDVLPGGCSAPNKQGPNWSTVVPEGVDATTYCCVADCNSADATFNCPTGSKDNGQNPMLSIPVTQAEYTSSCCTPTTCSDAGQTCGAGSRAKPGMSSILLPNFNNFQSVCCEQDCNSADNVYDCSSALKDNGANPALSWPLSQSQYDSQCCTPKLCPDAGTTCGAGSTQKPGYSSLPLPSAANHQATCCQQDCTSADTVYNCSPGSQDNGANPPLTWPLSQAQYDSNCCSPTLCPDAGLACGAGSVQKPGFSSIPLPNFGNFQATCCQQDCNSADAVFNCGAGLKDNGANPALSYPITQAAYDSSCCTPTLCPDAGRTCGAGSRPKPNMANTPLPNFANYQSVCCEQDCNSADSAFDCSAGLKDNGANPTLTFPITQAAYDSQCCTPKLCPDAGATCGAGSRQKAGYSSLPLPNSASHQSVCCEQDCNSADSAFDCSSGLKDNGANPTLSWPISQSAYNSQCCTPTLCPDAGETCSAGTRPKPNMANTPLPNFANYQSVCCEQDCNSADAVFNCGAGLKDNGANPALSYPITQATYNSQCCTPTLCPDAGQTCGQGSRQKSGFTFLPLPNFANFQATCCEQDCNSADAAFDCGAGLKDNGANPALTWPITQATYNSQCCTPTLCPDAGRTCGSGSRPKPNMASTPLPNFNDYQSVCCEQDCNSADSAFDCSAGLKDNGANPALSFPISQSAYDSQCCTPRLCPDAGQTCGAGSTQKAGYSSIPLPSAANHQATCCEQDCNSADTVYNCGSGLKDNGANPDLSWPLSQSQYDSSCCTPTLCPDANTQCQPGSVRKSGYTSILLPNLGQHQSVCCEQDCNSADSVYDCSAGLKDNGANPTLSWPLSQASYDSQCCTPTLCGDAGRTCAAGTDEKPNIASILLPNFNNFQSVCCEQDCDSADRVLNCGAGLKDNGRNSALAFPLSQAEYDSKCCEVTVCPDAQMACDASTERKPGYATIPLPNFANFQATCCQQSCNTADNVFDCSSANKDNGANPALPFPITQTIYDSYCCTPKLCPDQLPRGCEPPTVFANAPGFETTPAPSPDTATDICCIPLLEQKYPFPYCRCEGSFNASINADNQYAPASGDSFRADQANPGSDILLPFRLTPGSVAMSDTVNEYCFNLHFLGTETPTNPKNIRQWCRAQSTLQRIEFLSSRDCSKDKYSVVFRTTYEGQEVELPMGVEDQWEDQNTGILKFNRVQHPINGALFTPFGAEDRTDVFPAVLGFTPKDSGYVKAAAKVVKIGDYLDKGMGFAIGSGQGMSALLASKGGNPGSTEAPVALGSMCIRLKTANTACSNLASFCGGYFADGYDSLAPGTATNFRCQWALMESRNQRCCPVQTTLETSV
eukprot:CAMPEP_0202858474 /NCGR_PEP_ID=MMETSP1391-20130828/992_1 /ASSEMBLY_ACC=CAM_ASM_000867 /TAXON_ID=1034604 /ORGANISM="Chlamydomonas leiostraca, Strain SAG 11-49" /LENGTH=1588 /DNA_ID=CAMNT_0049537397 /DNA_START=164 /DNA_END=4930 /DNA_ORIENTATION=+